MRYQFQVWDEANGGLWVTVFSDSNSHYCFGYLDGHMSLGFRRPSRVWDSSKEKVMYSDVGDKILPLGMIVGFPSPEQYEEAAQKALEKAQLIRKHKELWENKKDV